MIINLLFYFFENIGQIPYEARNIKQTRILYWQSSNKFWRIFKTPNR